MLNERNPARLHRINQEIEALGRAIEEITAWIDQCDADEVSEHIDDLLAVVSGGADFIADMISELETEREPEVVMALEA